MNHLLRDGLAYLSLDLYDYQEVEGAAASLSRDGSMTSHEDQTLVELMSIAWSDYKQIMDAYELRSMFRGLQLSRGQTVSCVLVVRSSLKPERALVCVGMVIMGLYNGAVRPIMPRTLRRSVPLLLGDSAIERVLLSSSPMRTRNELLCWFGLEKAHLTQNYVLANEMMVAHICEIFRIERSLERIERQVYNSPENVARKVVVMKKVLPLDEILELVFGIVRGLHVPITMSFVA